MSEGIRESSQAHKSTQALLQGMSPSEQEGIESAVKPDDDDIENEDNNIKGNTPTSPRRKSVYYDPARIQQAQLETAGPKNESKREDSGEQSSHSTYGCTKSVEVPHLPPGKTLSVRNDKWIDFLHLVTLRARCMLNDPVLSVPISSSRITMAIPVRHNDTLSPPHLFALFTVYVYVPVTQRPYHSVDVCNFIL